MNLLVGTSGYSYKEWKGGFYPEDLPATEMLRHYGTQLPAVEINNTFYRLPRASVVESWASQVPEDFRFAIKASQRITHKKRLRNAEDETGYLFKTLDGLKGRLGAVLFQLPPYVHKDVAKLSAFLPLIPEGVRAAFEFRHESWMDEEVHETLERHNAAWCLTDAYDPSESISTADWGYVRFRDVDQTDSQLSRWLKCFAGHQWDPVYAFFKHEESIEGPEQARRFLDLKG